MTRQSWIDASGPLPMPGHKIYPYQLRGVPVLRPKQVWSTAIPASA